MLPRVRSQLRRALWHRGENNYHWSEHLETIVKETKQEVPQVPWDVFNARFGYHLSTRLIAVMLKRKNAKSVVYYIDRCLDAIIKTGGRALINDLRGEKPPLFLMHACKHCGGTLFFDDSEREPKYICINCARIRYFK